MPSWKWNKEDRLYYSGGKAVSAKRLREYVAKLLEASRERMADTTAKYVEGEINRPQWAIDMRTEIKRAHVAMAMLSQGGRDVMDEARWGRAGGMLKSQFTFLRGFERDIANKRAGSDAQIAARAQLYANSIHHAYETGVVAREKSAGVRKVRRVLGNPATGHCSDCPSLAGEYDIDKVPPIGQGTACASACRCTIEPFDSAEPAAI